MKLAVIAVGRVRKGHWRDATDLYLGRLRRIMPVEEIEVRAARKNERKDTRAAVEQEGRALLAALPDNALVVALDEHGREMSSKKLSDWINTQMIYDSRTICFVIGGALGLSRSVRERADIVLSMSKMTLPHELARVMLAEQLYRAMTIIRGEPYHKA